MLCKDCKFYSHFFLIKKENRKCKNPKLSEKIEHKIFKGYKEYILYKYAEDINPNGDCKYGKPK